MAIHARPRVLVVDDQPTGRRAMVMRLARWDLEVIQSHNGQDAVDRCAEERFDLIFMDLRMPPGIDGIETTRLIRQQRGDNARAPVIVYTSDAAYQERQVWSDAGFDGSIAKAVTDAALVEVLDRWKLLENR